MVSTTELTTRVKESATIQKGPVTIRMQPAGIGLNTETKMRTKRLTGMASGAVTTKVISVTVVAMAEDPVDVPQIF